jgi:hypothetical protein
MSPGVRSFNAADIRKIQVTRHSRALAFAQHSHTGIKRSDNTLLRQVYSTGFPAWSRKKKGFSKGQLILKKKSNIYLNNTFPAMRVHLAWCVVKIQNIQSAKIKEKVGESVKSTHARPVKRLVAVG